MFSPKSLVKLSLHATDPEEKKAKQPIITHNAPKIIKARERKQLTEFKTENSLFSRFYMLICN